MSRRGRSRQRGAASPLDTAMEGLANEPRLLTDARLLGALHAEIAAKHARAEAERTLFQMGLLHGLRDALGSVSLVGDRAGVGMTPRLAVSLDPRAGSEEAAAMRGCWPDAYEAGARVARLGRSDGVCCALSAGYTAGWYSGLLERDLVAVEQTCVARGDADCRFELRDTESWRELRDRRALGFLDGLPFQAFRDLALRSQATSGPPAPPARLADPEGGGDAPVVHVWGPVMVIPFSGVDEALRGLDLIGRDPAARAVSVVILDLTGAVLDSGSGAAALELVVSAVEGWGAEPLLAGIGPLAEQAAGDLERRGIAAHKDLPTAIAAAFQIARAQERTI